MLTTLTALKRNEASGLHSEAVEGAASLAIKRATPDSTKFMAIVERDVSAINSETGTAAAEASADESISTATACTHTGEGFLECDGAIFKRQTATTSLMNDLEKRDETMGMSFLCFCLPLYGRMERSPWHVSVS